MTTRRDFIRLSAVGTGVLAASDVLANDSQQNKPLVISTWNFGLAANVAAWGVLS